MKRSICLFLTAVCLTALLCGCDLRNRRPSSDFIPVDAPTETAPQFVEDATETEAAPVETAVMQVTVRDGMMEDGTYTDRYGHKYTYKYHVPYIDAEGRYAQGCNTEINQRFGAEVLAQRTAMQDGAVLSVLSVDYMTRLRGDILSLYITMKDTAGEETKAVYTLDRYSGEEVPGVRLLAWYGLDEETFLDLAEEKVRDYFSETYGEYSRSEMIRYNNALDRTLAEENFSVEMPMYFDEDDVLVIMATIYDLAGARHSEPIRIEYTPEPEPES